LNDSAFANQNFSLQKFNADKFFELGQQIIIEYNKIPCSELWNYESINSTVLQIQYYKDAGIFESVDDLNKVVNSCHDMLNHLQQQVEKGHKFLPGDKQADYGQAVKMYINEIILGNNSILVETDETKTAIINHIVLKYISTTDAKFVSRAFANFNNLVSRSMLISETGEKERVKFFKALHEKIEGCRK
jgi:hypothetical protein